MNEISITIPMDYNALTRASDMLHGLALDLNKQGHEYQADVEAEQSRTEAIQEADSIVVAELNVSEFNDQMIKNISDSMEVPVKDLVQPIPTPVAAVEGVDTDKNGLPWDERIHASTKTKVANGSWKRKRGVDDAVIADVEAELRQVMAIQSPKPVGTVTEHPQATAPVAAVPTPQPVSSPAVVPATAPVAAPPVEGITTLPQLMASATSNGITPEVMQSAALKFGLTSVALLGARPDLIPSVAAELGLAA